MNAITRSLGEEKSLAMPYFHSFTGCDTTSSFFRKGKKTAWEAWKSYPDVTTAFATIALDPFLDFNRQSQIFGLLQRFTVVLYSKGSTLEHVDELRKELFCRDNKLMENLPPHYFNMQDVQHIKPAFGQLVIEHNNKYLQLHKAGVPFGSLNV